MKYHNLFLILLTIGCTSVFGQSDFAFKRNINGVGKEGWHSISLLPEIFERLNHDLGDLRIYSISDSDTVEIPYLLRIREDETLYEEHELSLFNRSNRNGILYLTFESTTAEKLNSLRLDFDEANYFGHVTLEGSDDRLEWFNITKDHRIVAIKKGTNDFRFSTIRFPQSTYRYLRLSISSDVDLHFRKATFGYNKVRPGVFRDIPLTWKMDSDRKTRQSFVDIKFRHYVPVTALNVEIANDEDFYRAFEMMYVRDSTYTEKGWHKNYAGMMDGYLTSFKNNAFDFPVVFTREVRLIVRDLDNYPLDVKHVSVAGPEVAIITYLKPGDNFMLYGHDRTARPSYDLAHFQNEVPEPAAVAVLDSHEEQLTRVAREKPLFEDRIWLWSIMGLVIVGLGFFTLKMMKK